MVVLKFIVLVISITLSNGGTVDYEIGNRLFSQRVKYFDD